MDTTNIKHRRRGLTEEQFKQVIDSIRKIQIGEEGLTKKAVIDRAFAEVFGGEQDRANWPIKTNSSAVDRYWHYAFPSEKGIRLGKGKKKYKVKKHKSPKPLLDDLRSSGPTPQIPMVPLECVFHGCPWCQRPIRALVVAAATVMTNEQQG